MSKAFLYSSIRGLLSLVLSIKTTSDIVRPTCNLTLATSTRAMALPAMKMGISGLKVVWMVSWIPRRLLLYSLSTEDVINVSGHRLSTAEIESALILHKGVAETAVIGTADELTGQAVYAFATLKP